MAFCATYLDYIVQMMATAMGFNECVWLHGAKTKSRQKPFSFDGDILNSYFLGDHTDAAV